MAADSTSLAVRQTVNSEVDPLHPILNDGVDEFILVARNWPLMPELADENGTLRVSVDPKYLPTPRAPQAPVVPAAPVVPQATAPSKLDKLYAPHFLRLERDLEAGSSHLPASVTVITDPKYLPRPQVPQAPVVPQATVPSELDELYASHFRRLERDLEAGSSHLPASVTEGKVATLNFVRVSAEGEAVFEPTLEDHVAPPAK